MSKRNGTQPKVYSYIRFSTPEQAEGDSERRQIDRAKAYAARQKMAFDESLRLIDRGRSAFKGHHESKGMLGPFLASVESGDIPAGSILFVENLDRLTRLEPFDAIELILFGLLKHGISIATADGASYSRHSLRDGTIYRLIGEISRAYEESKRKSDLGRENWRQKRKLAQTAGIKVTCRRHAWLRPVKNGKPLSDEQIKAGAGRTGGPVEGFILSPQAADAVRLIYEWKLNGYGNQTIASKLNEQHPWKPKNGWRISYVVKILNDPAVIGQYQPHRMEDGKRVPDGEPIQDYYPAAIDRDLFNAVQNLRRKNRGTGGRTGKVTNVFTNAKCAYCGGAMHVEDKCSPKSKMGLYLVCEQGKRKLTCKPYRIRLDLMEAAVLETCRQIRPEQILAKQDEHDQKSRKLRIAVEGKRSEVDELERRIKNLRDDREREDDPDERAELRSRIEQRKDEKSEAERALVEAEQALREAERSRQSVEAWRKDLESLKDKLTDIDVRIRLKAHLRELIERIEVFAHGLPEEGQNPAPFIPGLRSRGKRKQEPKTKDDFREVVQDLAAELEAPQLNDPRWQGFLDDLMTRRRTREGGFVRLQFRTGATMDVVPEGSLASGKGIGPDGQVGFVMPDLDRLWKRYIKTHSLKEQREQQGRNRRRKAG